MLIAAQTVILPPRLARDFNHGTLSNPVWASPSPLGEIEACFINTDELIWGVFKDSKSNTVCVEIVLQRQCYTVHLSTIRPTVCTSDSVL